MPDRVELKNKYLNLSGGTSLLSCCGGRELPYVPWWCRHELLQLECLYLVRVECLQDANFEKSLSREMSQVCR